MKFIRILFIVGILTAYSAHVVADAPAIFNSGMQEKLKQREKEREKKDEYDRMVARKEVAFVKDFPFYLEKRLRDMIIRGRKIEGIRFDAPGSKEIDTAPSDQLFSPLGGKAEYQYPLRGINDGSPWLFSKANSFDGVATPEADIAVFLKNFDEALCIRFNELWDIGTIDEPIPDYGAAPSFDSSYWAMENPVYLNSGEPHFGCFKDPGGILYYHQVLFRR